MGDIQSLLEKVESVVDEKKAETIAKKMMSGKFTLKDMCEQMEMISKMGPLKKIMDMIPLPFGLQDKIPEEKMIETQQKLKKFKVIIDSTTDEEKMNPEIIKSSRVQRIARGSGVETHEVKELLRYYKLCKRNMKAFMSNRKMRKTLMQQLKFAS